MARVAHVERERALAAAARERRERGASADSAAVLRRREVGVVLRLRARVDRGVRAEALRAARVAEPNGDAVGARSARRDVARRLQHARLRRITRAAGIARSAAVASADEAAACDDEEYGHQERKL